MSLNRLLALILFLLAGTAASAATADANLVVRSPDGRNAIGFTFDASNRPAYFVRRDEELVILPSPVLLQLADGPLGSGSRSLGAEHRSVDQDWRRVAGRSSLVRDHFNELRVHLVDDRQRRFDLILRAYDDGVALRTFVPVQHGIGTAIAAEETGFYLAGNYRCWGFNVGRFGTGHEGEFDPVQARHIREHNLYDVPLLCETGKGALLITESDLIDFPAMYLKGRGDGGLGLVSKLSPSLADPAIAAEISPGKPVQTPWRVVMLAGKAGELAASNLVDNLATPSRIEDTGWIRPGKASSDWLSGGWIDGGPVAVSSTRSIRALIDFAAQNGLEYVMVDDGWYLGSGVAPRFDPEANIFADAPNFDLKEVVAHARKRGVSLWVWLDWRALDPVMDRALQYLAAQGISGINVDFMDRDDQEMVRWYEKLLDAARRNRLMVEMHGAFVPRGLARTYPNFLTQEGVLGSEYNKWSSRITAGHNVMLAYTRGVLGPMDYIPGSFINVSPGQFEPRYVLPMAQTSRAHNLSMFVVYDSPWASLADSPDIYRNSPAGFDFVREVPTHWDETRFIAGEVGEYIALARRSGKRWYVGAMNGDAARTISLPLDFLGGGSWKAELWLDGNSPQAIRRETRQVDPDESLGIDLAASGGAVMRLEQN